MIRQKVLNQNDLLDSTEAKTTSKVWQDNAYFQSNYIKAIVIELAKRNNY